MRIERTLLFPILGIIPLRGAVNSNSPSHICKALYVLLDELEEVSVLRGKKRPVFLSFPSTDECQIRNKLTHVSSFHVISVSIYHNFLLLKVMNLDTIENDMCLVGPPVPQQLFTCEKTV